MSAVCTEALGAVSVRVHPREPKASGTSLAANGGLDAGSRVRVREGGLSAGERRKVVGEAWTRD